MIGHRPGFVGGQGYSLPVEPEITVDFAWIGNVSEDSAEVRIRSADAVTATLLLDTDPGLGSPSTVSGSEGADNVWTFALTGLDADTQYYYGFDGNEFTGRFSTFPTEGDPASFLICAASCSGGTGAQYATVKTNTSNTPAWDRIYDRDPLLFIHMGDLHYRNLNTSNVSSYHTAYKDVFANSRFKALAASVPIAYVYDDHDYSTNNSDGTYVNKDVAQEAYRDYVPHWDLPADTRMDGNGEVYQSFVIGRVRFILLDARSERTPNTATDNSSKTRIGDDQKAWLMDELLAATEPVIVLDVKASWVNTPTASDGWNKFTTERAELSEFFEDNSLTERLWLIGGDDHQLNADDGSHTQFDSGSVNDGPPYTGFAPLDANTADGGGTYSDGKFTTRRQQYGTMQFTDSGTDITVTAKGYAVNGTSESLKFTLSKVFTG